MVFDNIKRFFSRALEARFPNVLPNYWNSIWPQSQIYYALQGSVIKDVRNLIYTKSYVLEEVAAQWKGLDNDDIARNAFNWVRNNVTYQSDQSIHNTPEYWQDPEMTYNLRKGDCEDGALLIASLMKIAGVPSYRLKICAGWVKYNSGQAGHAYVIYLSEQQNEWFVLDWCYYPSEALVAFNKIPHNQMSNYEEIWWTCNDELCWAQHTTLLIQTLEGDYIGS